MQKEVDEKELCPFRKIGHELYPDNYCIATGSYCIHPTEFPRCDIWKQHTRLVDTLTNLIGDKKNEET